MLKTAELSAVTCEEKNLSLQVTEKTALLTGVKRKKKVRKHAQNHILCAIIPVSSSLLVAAVCHRTAWKCLFHAMKKVYAPFCMTEYLCRTLVVICKNIYTSAVAWTIRRE